MLTTSKAFHYFRPRRDEVRFAFDPPKFVDKITIEDKVSDFLWYILLKRYFTKFGQKFRVWHKELPKRFPKLVISVTFCQKFWSDLKIFRMEIKNASTTSSKTPVRHTLQPLCDLSATDNLHQSQRSQQGPRSVTARLQRSRRLIGDLVATKSVAARFLCLHKNLAATDLVADRSRQSRRPVPDQSPTSRRPIAD